MSAFPNIMCPLQTDSIKTTNTLGKISWFSHFQHIVGLSFPSLLPSIFQKDCTLLLYTFSMAIVSSFFTWDFENCFLPLCSGLFRKALVPVRNLVTLEVAIPMQKAPNFHKSYKFYILVILELQGHLVIASVMLQIDPQPAHRAVEYVPELLYWYVFSGHQSKHVRHLPHIIL